MSGRLGHNLGVDVGHLHLHVRDVARSAAFYRGWFGLAERVRHGPIVFLAGDRGFDLALAPDPEPAPLPAWHHLGFRLEAAAAVRELHRRMQEGAVPLTKELVDEPGYVSFQCADPDGYRVEVYWE